MRTLRRLDLSHFTKPDAITRHVESLVNVLNEVFIEEHLRLRGEFRVYRLGATEWVKESK